MQNLDQYLNKTFPFTGDDELLNPDPCMSSQFTVQMLLSKLLYDEVFQDDVLEKLKEYTGQTTVYLSGQHLKPKKLTSFLPILQKFLDDGPSIELIVDNPVCFVIEFIINPYDYEIYEIADIWASNIVNNDGVLNAEHPGSMYDYPAIIFKGIAHQKAIDKLGQVGFVAALLIFMKWNLLTDIISNRNRKHNSLQDQIAFQFAQKVNEAENRIQAILELPKEIYDNSYFRKCLREDIQTALFNEVDDCEGFIKKVNNDMTVIMKKWYVTIDDKIYISRIEYPEEKITKVYEYNADLEVVNIKEEPFSNQENDEENDEDDEGE